MIMSSVIYAIVFKGEVLEGYQVISVKAHLARLLKVNAGQIAKLFSGKQVVIKKTTDKAVAIKYGTALKKAGADVKVRVIKSNAVAARKPVRATPSQTRSPTTTPSAADSGFILVPNIGDIFDAAPETPSPSIDLSDLSIAAAGEGTLGEPHETVELELDLSLLVLSEPGEGTLAEPQQEVPKLTAPDFGLDEPGAVLETLHEEVELLNPDTSSMSIAAAGVDLLPEEEKQSVPDPKVPDISDISLVTNFDV
jgi:hypothetical protein